MSKSKQWSIDPKKFLSPTHLKQLRKFAADRAALHEAQGKKQAVKDSDEARVVALNNDRDAFRLFLQRFASDAIIDRHEANGMLFNAYFEKPGFAEALLDYLSGSYDEIRDEGAG